MADLACNVKIYTNHYNLFPTSENFDKLTNITNIYKDTLNEQRQEQLERLQMSKDLAGELPSKFVSNLLRDSSSPYINIINKTRNSTTQTANTWHTT